MCPLEFNIFSDFSILVCTPDVNIAVPCVTELSITQGQQTTAHGMNLAYSLLLYCQ